MHARTKNVRDSDAWKPSAPLAEAREKLHRRAHTGGMEFDKYLCLYVTLYDNFEVQGSRGF